MKEPCVNCDKADTDEYGYFCDIACGKRTAWLNYLAGMKELMNFKCEVCSTPHFVHLVVPISKLKEWGLDPH